MAQRTESSTVIAAPPAAVLDVIADVAAYPTWNPEFTAVEVLTEDDGWAEQVRFRLEAGPIKDTYTLDYRWDVDEDGTGVVSWSLVEGGVLKAMDGSYTLTAVDAGTEVTYALSVDARLPMLGAVRRKAEQRIIDGALAGLTSRVES
ncbi:SRPBCC family protein [Arsenicicoccus sp. oral taxon 190]|uniref:SRPBCC family protein n=1 Tax=Arsenicicoccus sp. oral taxon 190 TaxID=1658671 RepID=UPI00067A3B3B|nr:SRPBCC family protein [Arsenicicoccus sp. oral taxon 190]AKT52048.1 cyclase [Arsenicicoccus sp. oral taxon 190]